MYVCEEIYIYFFVKCIFLSTVIEHQPTITSYTDYCQDFRKSAIPTTVAKSDTKLKRNIVLRLSNIPKSLIR